MEDDAEIMKNFLINLQIKEEKPIILRGVVRTMGSALDRIDRLSGWLQRVVKLTSEDITFKIL